MGKQPQLYTGTTGPKLNYLPKKICPQRATANTVLDERNWFDSSTKLHFSVIEGACYKGSLWGIPLGQNPCFVFPYLRQCQNCFQIQVAVG